MKYTSLAELLADIEQNPIEKTGHLYHPIPFPEFAKFTISSEIKGVYEKWDLISKKVAEIFGSNIQNRKILDIGANGGFYTFNFAQAGCAVVAFEPHPRYSQIGYFLAKEKTTNVVWHPKEFSVAEIKDAHFDLVLMLSVFQWMAAGGENIENAFSELREISQHCDYMLFELGYNRGKSCLKTSKKNHYAALIKMLKLHTSYHYFQLIGQTTLWQETKRYLVLCSNDSRFADQGWQKLSRLINI